MVVIKLVQVWNFQYEIDVKDVWYLDVSNGSRHTVFDHYGKETDQYDYTDLRPEDYQLAGFRTRAINVRHPTNDIEVQAAFRRMIRHLPDKVRAVILNEAHISLCGIEC